MKFPFRVHVLSWLVVSASVLPSAARLHAQTVSIPAFTPMPVQLAGHVPMKIGEPLEARMLYPVYAANQLVIPAGCIFRGHVVQLLLGQTASRPRQIVGRFHAVPYSRGAVR